MALPRVMYLRYRERNATSLRWGRGTGTHFLLSSLVVQELAGALQSAHPKIQRMCEEESDDPEAVNKLLEINDSIHRTIERYKLMKKGDFDGATSIPKGTLGTKTGVSKNANNELSLIDFDPEPVPSVEDQQHTDTAAPGSSSLENDLLGLSFQEQVPAPANGISLGQCKSFLADLLLLLLLLLLSMWLLCPKRVSANQTGW